MGRLSISLGLPIVVGLLTVLCAPLCRAETGDPVLINEILVHHEGNMDNCEFLELYGVPLTSLDGLSVIIVYATYFYAGTIAYRFDFDASHALGANGFFLLGNFFGVEEYYDVTPDVIFGHNTFVDLSQTIALVETSSLTGGVGDEITEQEVVRDAVGIRFISDFENTFFYGAPIHGPDGLFSPAGVCRKEDGVDTDGYLDWKFASYQLPGSNTPTSAGPALGVKPSSWGELKDAYR